MSETKPLFIDKKIINKSTKTKTDAISQKLRRSYSADEISKVKKYLFDKYPDINFGDEIMRSMLYLENNYNIQTLKCSSEKCFNIKKWNKSDSRWELFCGAECREDNKALWKSLRYETLSKNNLEKYNVINVSQLKWVQLKKEETTRKNYGVINPFMIPELKSKYINNQNRKSKMELSLLSFIKDNYSGEVISGWKDLGVEIDIYLPELKIGIEYNGVYWHSVGKNNTSDINKIKHQHKKKTNLLLENGIQLLHVFESDDIDKWKEFILNKLQLSERIFARKTEIRSISFSEAKQFLKENHMQGSVNTPKNYGLFYKNKLVACMSFIKSRFGLGHWELARFCNLNNTVVIGGASKLLNHFEKEVHPKSIISYANRRWSNGDLYKILGFKLHSISQPSMYIIKGSTLYSRLSFQKHKLEKILPNFDKKLTAIANLINNNYRLIWDSGQITYIKGVL